MIYLDNAATTRPSEGCAEAVSGALRQLFGNPSSLYDLGFEAEKALEGARETIASALGCKPKELLFTSSGTEANNLAVLGSARARRGWGSEAVCTGYEHPSVDNCAKELAREGFIVKYVRPKSDGLIDPEEIVASVNERTALVCAMSVNNETGARLDAAAIAKRVKEKNKRTAFHCDNVQGFLKHPLALDGAVDTCSVSAHKIHGPKGIGALYIRGGFHIENVLFGGHQERGLRPGTENAPYSLGFAAAVNETISARFDPTPLRDALREGIKELEGAVINSPLGASPYIFNFSLVGLKSEPLLRFLSGRGIYVSSGSACSKGERSHTLAAASLPDAVIDSAVRVSFSTENTPEDVRALLAALKDARSELINIR